MRIHIKNTQNILHNLAITIEKDPLSVESWHCCHIEILERLLIHFTPKQLLELSKQYQDTFKDCDGDVVFCADGDALIISRNMTSHEMNILAFDMCKSLNLPEDVIIRHYNLCDHWKSVYSLLLAKSPEAPQQMDLLDSIEPRNHPFGEIEALQEVFDGIKQTRPGRNPMHILLVEDDKVTRRLVSNVFKDNYAVITAENAEEAVTNYLLHAPDIVFLDINLPDTNGFDVLHQIIDIDNDAHVIMFSGNSYLDNVTHALTHGAKGFIAKPFKREKLTHYIQEYAELHHKHAV